MRNKNFSHNCFFKALVDLSHTKKIENIGIQEICEKAGFNRSTFYRSYYSKEDILIIEFKKGLIEYRELVENSKDFSFINKMRLLFDLLRKNMDLMLLIHEAGLDNKIYDLFYDIYPINGDYDIKYGKYFKPFRTAGVFKVIINWMTDGAKESSIEMAYLLADIMNNCNADY